MDSLAGNAASPESLMQRLQTLTRQQARVLALVCKGRLNKQIAWELGVTEATVKAHVSAVLMKLEVDSRTQAAVQIAAVGVALLTGMPLDG